MIKETHYTWEDFNKDILMLCSKIALFGWFPDYIVGIKKGGLVPAVKLSNILNKPLLIVSCQLRDSYGIDFEGFDEKISKNKKFLVVDDICDSGETFEKVSQELNIRDYKNIRFCSLYHNIRQNFLTDYYARKIDREKDDRWIVYPWEI
jgi:hypoxanthine phosphoribosyltransferase